MPISTYTGLPVRPLDETPTLLHSNDLPVVVVCGHARAWFLGGVGGDDLTPEVLAAALETCETFQVIAYHGTVVEAAEGYDDE
jgi:hypothetical protein